MMTDQVDLFYRFGVALAIGLLVGLQREYALGEPQRELFAGIRTFALLGLTGCTAALLAAEMDSPWPLVAVVLAGGGFLIMAYYVAAMKGEIGLTTEVAALLTLLVGALCYWGYLALAVAVGVATTVLLSLKQELQKFISRITREDVFATLKFAIITAIVLPILPNQDYGFPPLDVFNPYNIWLMVIFISGISFLGYVLIKVVGPHQGIGLTGFLGGLVSSTAVTLSFAQRSRQQPELTRPLALAITVSWTTMFVRVLVIVLALNAALLQLLWAPMVAAMAIGLGYGAFLYLAQQTDEEGNVDFSNPFELRPAIQFGLLYAVVLFASKAAQTYLGDTGIYISSVAAGLADLNAISLSMAELSRGPEGLALGTAARAIVLATMANTAVKGIIVMTTGTMRLRRVLLPGFLLILIVGVSVVFLTT